ncbi:MAG TPA: response regulator [Holophaga sp.]|nr:response regulator [Holophaga sp.]
MEPQILFVDDDPNILAAYTRVLRRRYHIRTAQGGEEGLQVIQAEGPFAVVVADMRMPGMDGVVFLSHVRNFNPDTVRIMLTGNVDLSTAVEAVNQGNIFRFLTKPCEPDVLATALDDALGMYRLVTAEHELLEKTLKGSIDLLVELLSTLDPLSFGRATTSAGRSERIARLMRAENPWAVSLATVLSQIGVLTIPTTLMAKARGGGLLNPSEREVLDRVPEIGSNLLRHIPRLEDVANVIHYMNKNFNGSGYPKDALAGEEIPIGARILRVVFDYQDLEPKKRNMREAIEHMRSRTAWYDPAVVSALEQVLREEPGAIDDIDKPRTLPLRDLRVGHMLHRGVFTADGLLVVPEGTVLGPSHLEKMRNFARLSGLKEPIWVTGPDPS